MTPAWRYNYTEEITKRNHKIHILRCKFNFKHQLKRGGEKGNVLIYLKAYIHEVYKNCRLLQIFDVDPWRSDRHCKALTLKIGHTIKMFPTAWEYCGYFIYERCWSLLNRHCCNVHMVVRDLRDLRVSLETKSCLCWLVWIREVVYGINSSP